MEYVWNSFMRFFSLALVQLLFSLIIAASIGSNPGLVAIWQDERQRRQDENDDSDISPPISQGIYIHLDRLSLPLLSLAYVTFVS